MSRFAVYEQRNHKFRLLSHYGSNKKAQERATARNIENYESGNGGRSIRVVPFETEDPPQKFESWDDMSGVIRKNAHLFPRSW